MFCRIHNVIYPPNDIIRNMYLVSSLSSWHRASKTLVISWVIGLIRTSFILILSHWPPNSWHSLLSLGNFLSDGVIRASCTELLTPLELLGDGSAFCSDGRALCGLQDSFKVGLVTRKTKLWLQGWNSQPHALSSGEGGEAGHWVNNWSCLWKRFHKNP